MSIAEPVPADVVGAPAAPVTTALPESGAGRAAKRIVDVLLGVPLCLLAIPLIAAFALVLAVQLRGSPFFVHDREGHRGTLRIPKLRTLPAQFPVYADKTTVPLRPASGFASMLRRTHLDELPQLFLVPIGRLSLVGPRPLMPAEAATAPADYRHLRTRVRQGCTGLWQVSAEGHHRVTDAPEYDCFYVQHRSLRLDAWILWRTVARFAGGRGVTLDDVPAWARRADADPTDRP